MDDYILELKKSANRLGNHYIRLTIFMSSGLILMGIMALFKWVYPGMAVFIIGSILLLISLREFVDNNKRYAGYLKDEAQKHT